MSKTKPRLSQESAEAAFWRQGGWCAAGCGRRAEVNHHVFSQQRWPEFVDEETNIVQLCHDCHANHHTAMHRLPRVVARHAERLAVTPQQQDWLTRVYGRR